MSLATATALAAARMTAPLAVALQGPDQFVGLLAELGVDVDIDPADFPVVAELFPVAEDLTRLAELAETLATDDVEAADAVVATLDVVLGVLDAVEALRGLSAGSISQLAAPLDNPDTWAGLATDLPGHLFVTWLRLEQPLTFALFVLGGVVTGTDQGAAQPPRYDVDWEAAGRLLTDPAGQLRDTYNWGGAYDHARLLSALAACLRAAGVPAGLADVPIIVSPSTQAGVRALRTQIVDEPLDAVQGSITANVLAVPVPAEGAAPDAEPSRLLITNEVLGSASCEIDLGDGWSLTTTGGATATGGLGIIVGPDGVARAAGAAAAGGTLRIAAAPDGGWMLLGGPVGTRLELRSVMLELTSEGTVSDPELRVSAGSADGFVVIVDPGDADSFVGALLGALALEIVTGLTVEWSSRDGVTFGGQLGFDLIIVVDRSIGPVHIDRLALRLGGGGDGLSVAVTVTASAVLGPFTVVVDGIGLSLALVPAPDGRGTIGGADLAVGFRPPAGVGLALDLGVVSGGGFLYIDPNGGGFAGVLELTMLGVGICAFGIVRTDLPGGDWSLLFALFIEIPSIQLGFGFTLTGVGGLAGIHRTLDEAALRSAVRAGALDDVLFPANPIADAPMIIDRLQSIFPSSPGRTVIGPVVRIGWGTPSLIEAEIGVIVTTPDPIKVAVLGSIGASLPTEHLDLVAIHVDVGGVIDTGAGTLDIFASLHDSHVIGFALSGDMALHTAVGDLPSFLMGHGGHHPGFDPPIGFPVLNRLSLAINAGSVIHVYFGCYIALTSNTVQFGSRLEISAKIEGFGIEGGTEFDALVQFSPFLVATRLGFHIAVVAGGVDLIGVWLDATVKGPNPWQITGTARFTVLGFEEHFSIDEVIGSPRTEPSVETADLRALVRAALAEPAAWSVGADVDTDVIVAAGQLAPGELVADPCAALAVAQQAAPLGMVLDKVGDAAPGPYTSFTLEPGAQSTASSGDVLDWFAPGYYLVLDSDEGLSSPSFELLAAGIEFGGAGATAGRARSASLDFEQKLRDPELEDETVQLGVLDMEAKPRYGGLTSIHHGSAFQVAAGATGVSASAATQYQVVDRLTGDLIATTSSWTAGHQLVSARAAAGSIVPNWERAS